MYILHIRVARQKPTFFDRLDTFNMAAIHLMQIFAW